MKAIKKLLTLSLALLLSVGLVGCSSDKKPSEPVDLTGTWQTKNSEGSYQEATITGDTIEINWVNDEEKTKSLYWAGSFTAPTEAGETYSWTSNADKEKNDSALLASSDDTKEFKYENGKITYEASMMGVTKTMELTKK